MNYKFFLIFIIMFSFFFILLSKNVEHLTFDQMKNQRLKDNRKKPIFNIIIDENKLNKDYINTKGFGSQTALNIYKVNYNNTE